MSKYVTSVRFLVKQGKLDEFLDGIRSNPNRGETYSHTVKTGDLTFVWNAIFESEEALINSRSGMISNLDRLRDFLQEISPELGVTDPVSGPIVEEKQI
ncbi:hypothetical protein OAS67_01845 [Alphaproteobacteria bacterium]|jgi:hypothetical protein|nr:hypothetical protein [Alphaproteobacteria bacterium]